MKTNFPVTTFSIIVEGILKDENLREFYLSIKKQNSFDLDFGPKVLAKIFLNFGLIFIFLTPNLGNDTTFFLNLDLTVKLMFNNRVI